MASWIAPLLALPLMLGLGGQTAPGDPVAETRALLETQLREIRANIADRAWMQDSVRAAIVRRSIERNWNMCAANEGTAQAKASERPARLLAEAALTLCKPWEDAFALALQNGADPYVNGLVSREDMIATAQLQARDEALGRIFLWRGVPAPGQPAPTAPQGMARAAPQEPYGRVPLVTSVLLEPAFPKAPTPAPTAKPAEPKANETELVVVAQVRNQCSVRLADRTLTESQLAANARQWAADGTALRIVRPRGANYGCIAKIARHLNEYGVHLIQVVEP